MRIRRTRYGTFEQPVTLAFISGIDTHPEILDDAPPPAPPAQPPRLEFEREARWSERNIRRMLGKDPKQQARRLNHAAFARTMSRIMRGQV